MERTQRAIKSLTDFMIGGGFPAFFLALLFFYELFLLVMLLAPASSSGLGAFAEDFRVWCLGYDPATGRTQWAYVISMATPQIFLGLIVAMMWWKPLCEHLARPWALVPQVAAAAIVIAGLVGGLVLVADPPPTGELAFPADAPAHPSFCPADLPHQPGEPADRAGRHGGQGRDAHGHVRLLRSHLPAHPRAVEARRREPQPGAALRAARRGRDPGSRQRHHRSPLPPGGACTRWRRPSSTC